MKVTPSPQQMLYLCTWFTFTQTLACHMPYFCRVFGLAHSCAAQLFPFDTHPHFHISAHILIFTQFFVHLYPAQYLFRIRTTLRNCFPSFFISLMLCYSTQLVAFALPIIITKISCYNICHCFMGFTSNKFSIQCLSCICYVSFCMILGA